LAYRDADVLSVANYAIIHREATSKTEHLCLGTEIFIDGALSVGDFFYLALGDEPDTLIELMDIVALPHGLILLGSLATNGNDLEHPWLQNTGYRQHGFATNKRGDLVGINLSPLCDEIVPTSHWTPLQGKELIDLVNSGLLDNSVSAVPVFGEIDPKQRHATESNVISIGDWKESQAQRHRFGGRS